MSLINAAKLGWRSLGDDAARAAMGKEAQQAIRNARINDATKTMSARELADAMPEIEKYGVDFLNDFHAAYKQPVFDSMPENLAYGASRRVGGVVGGANQMVQGMGGIPGVALQAAFIAPMFMQGGGEPQPTEEELQQQQLMQYQQQQQQQRYR